MGFGVKEKDGSERNLRLSLGKRAYLMQSASNYKTKNTLETIGDSSMNNYEMTVNSVREINKIIGQFHKQK